jgi:hypothetical protein
MKSIRGIFSLKKDDFRRIRATACVPELSAYATADIKGFSVSLNPVSGK